VPGRGALAFLKILKLEIIYIYIFFRKFWTLHIGVFEGSAYTKSITADIYIFLFPICAAVRLSSCITAVKSW
jgi:hypothetical protein